MLASRYSHSRGKKVSKTIASETNCIDKPFPHKKATYIWNILDTKVQQSVIYFLRRIESIARKPLLKQS